jgi:nucleotide-binding universal stress UspA family protein
MKVLVPLDGSRLADGMLAHARRFVGQDGSEVHLLRVLPEAGGSQADREDRFAEAHRHLGECRELLEGDGRVVTTRVVEGDPAEQILLHAETDGFDLIAMATHGRTGAMRWLRGSVAERVLRHAPIPVFLANPEGLVLQGDGLEIGKVLVPLDGSPHAERAVPLALDLAVAEGAEVELLHVDQPGRGGVHPVAEVASRNAQKRAEQLLDDLRNALEERGVKRTHVVGRYGPDPAAEILDVLEAAKPDLVVMSSHGRTGLRRFRFGSVAEKVLRRCTCPVLVVPPEANPARA